MLAPRGYDPSLIEGIQNISLIYSESYGCGLGIVGGRVGGWGIANEGGVNCVIRIGSKDGLTESVTFKSIGCSFLYKVKVRIHFCHPACCNHSTWMRMTNWPINNLSNTINTIRPTKT